MPVKVGFKKMVDDDEDDRNFGQELNPVASTEDSDSNEEKKVDDTPKSKATSKKPLLRSSLRASCSKGPNNASNSGKNRVSTKDERRSSSRGKSFGLSSFRSSLKNNTSGNDSKKKTSRRSALADSQDSYEMEDDPVMAVFKARATQRVRFSLEGMEGGNTPQASQTASKYARVNVEISANGSVSSNTSTNGSSFNIKKFMKGALRLKSTNAKDGERDDYGTGSSEDFDAVMAKEIEVAKNDNADMVWESAQGSAGSEEVVYTKRNILPISGKGKQTVKAEQNQPLSVSFTEDSETRAQVIKLLNKSCRAQYVHFQYEYSVKCCVRALELLRKANYPDDHPTVLKTLESLNSAHHSLNSYRNSANIVKMGIKYEDSGELIRALKMYTIAYRIRRDNLSPNHPSLIVLLNMLGSIQVKRGEFEEAMEIYELALKDDVVMHDGEDSENEESRPPSNNLMAQSVAYRELGTIYEQWGEVEGALKMYHKSLDCIADYKGISLKASSMKAALDKSLDSTKVSEGTSTTSSTSPSAPGSPTSVTEEDILLDLESVQLSRSFTKHTSVVKANNNEDDGDESGGMELFIGSKPEGIDSKDAMVVTSSCYDIFFPYDSTGKAGDKANKSDRNKTVDYADADVALTLHQIGQLHRAEGEYNLALAAYNVSLRGMKQALGENHPNVAAILGNMGNLQKEMGDMTAAFETYQQVLEMESKRLGMSHPDVVITLHNIATIDSARGNYENALALYRQVMDLQKKLFGENDVSLSVTAACMGDVYERIADIDTAVECFEIALRIKTAALGRHSLEVARILHKLGKLAVLTGDYHLADSYLSRTVLIYRLNKLPEDDEWVVDAHRDCADIEGVIAMGQGHMFEC